MPSKTLTTKIICSSSTDPWYNLALEEYLLEIVKKNEIYLYLWQNKDTVVIGRNQNPWKECRCKVLESNGGKLARRLSGGGTVYHDLGNLNFTFIMDKDIYDLNRQLQVIIDAVKEIGIDAEFSGRNDIIVDGKKFSGNAYYFKEFAAYHHGTILIDTDFENLINYLQVSKEKIVSKGIDSVRSRVINLKSIDAEINIESVKSSIKTNFISNYGGHGSELEINNCERVKEIYEKYSSWEWRYGQTPDFDLIFSTRFNWGSIEIGFKLKDGYIVSSKIYSDSLAADLIQNISCKLKDIPLDIKNIVKRISGVSVLSKDEQLIIQDVCGWLKTKSVEF